MGCIRVAALLLCMGLSLCSKDSLAVPHYKIQILQHLADGPKDSLPQAINDHGWVVGVAAGETSQSRAILWRNGAVEDIGRLFRDEYATAYGINNSGQVVGASSQPPYPHVFGRSEAYIWQNGWMTGLGSFGDVYDYSVAVAISNSGVIVGTTVSKSGNGFSPFIWKEGQMIDISEGWDEPLTTARAHAVNDHGMVVGYNVDRRRSFLYFNGTTTDIVGPAGWDYVSASAINNGGTIAVNGYRAMTGGSSESVAALIDGGVAKVLERPQDALQYGFRVSDLNDASIAVGQFSTSFQSAARSHAAVWIGGSVFDLNDLVLEAGDLHLTVASAINAHGQIVGQAISANGDHAAVLLTPVPELPTLPLAAFGLVGVALIARKRRARLH